MLVSLFYFIFSFFLFLFLLHCHVIATAIQEEIKNPYCDAIRSGFYSFNFRVDCRLNEGGYQGGGLWNEVLLHFEPPFFFLFPFQKEKKLDFQAEISSNLSLLSLLPNLFFGLPPLPCEHWGAHGVWKLCVFVFREGKKFFRKEQCPPCECSHNTSRKKKKGTTERGRRKALLCFLQADFVIFSLRRSSLFFLESSPFRFWSSP